MSDGASGIGGDGQRGEVGLHKLHVPPTDLQEGIR